jgi:hypothetical protein
MNKISRKGIKRSARLSAWGNSRTPLFDESISLSWMAKARHDVCPQLLLLYVSQCPQSVAPVVDYGTRYLQAWCARKGLHRWAHVHEAAAKDALVAFMAGRFLRDPDFPGVRQRCLSLHISSRDYVLLRKVALDAFRHRFSDAVFNYGLAWEDDVKTLAPTNRYSESRRS